VYFVHTTVTKVVGVFVCAFFVRRFSPGYVVRPEKCLYLIADGCSGRSAGYGAVRRTRMQQAEQQIASVL
jgi:hypothetical protein